MTKTILLNAPCLESLDLSPVQTVIEPWRATQTLVDHEQDVQFQIEYPQDPEDQREFSEIPEIRLWFVRLDTIYPWLPFLLDWRAGELARYAAMLVPHQFSTKEGIQYNPEALDIFIMGKIFVLSRWLQQQQIEGESRLKNMAEMFGYELDPGLFVLLCGPHA